jgi:hypothetical protein
LLNIFKFVDVFRGNYKMKKILSIIFTIILVFSVFGVNAVSSIGIYSQGFSNLDDYNDLIIFPEILSSLANNKQINEDSTLDNNYRIYGFIKYSNGSSVVNSTVLL